MAEKQENKKDKGVVRVKGRVRFVDPIGIHHPFENRLQKLSTTVSYNLDDNKQIIDKVYQGSTMYRYRVIRKLPEGVVESRSWVNLSPVIPDFMPGENVED